MTPSYQRQPACPDLFQNLTVRRSARRPLRKCHRPYLHVESDLRFRTDEFSARLRAVAHCHAEFDGPLNEIRPHRSRGGSPAAGAGHSMPRMARVVFPDAPFGVDSVRNLETLLPANSIRLQRTIYPRRVHGFLLIGGAIFVWALRL